MSRQQVTNILTLILVGGWIVVAIGRVVWHWPAAPAIDAIMPLVIGYWFASKNGKNGAPT